ncbi:MAG: cell division protein SepF [Christensenellales bacterium]
MDDRDNMNYDDVNGRFRPRMNGDYGMGRMQGDNNYVQRPSYVPPQPAPITRNNRQSYPSQPPQFSGYQQQPYGGQGYQQEEFDYDVNNQQYSAPVQYAQPKKKKGFFSFGKKEEVNEQSGGAYNNVIITYPKTIQDVQTIIDSLRNRQAIIVDMSKINDKGCQRIMDYLSGAIYALGGAQQRIADNMFLFTPDGVSIQGPSDLRKKYD